MRRAILLLALSAAPPALAEPGPEVLAAIGKLGPIAIGAWNCTATLVAPDRIATARHCIGRAEETSGEVRDTFRPGYGGPQASPLAATVRYQSLPAMLGVPDYARDQAVAWLRGPIEDVTPIDFAPAPGEGEMVTVVSYPNAEDGPPRIDTCPVRSVEDTVVQLNCDAESGMSGAPVLVEDEDGWRIAAVMVARLAEGRSLAIAFDPASYD